GERLLYIPESYRESWAAIQGGRPNHEGLLFDKYVELVGFLHRRGVQILAGTDVVKPFFVPSFSLHDELGLLVSSGLTEMEALQAATRDATRFVDLHDVGTIEQDMVADLVLLNTDPIENIGNTRSVASVVSAGQFFGRAELKAISSNIRRNAASWAGDPTGR
ncbi:MAG: amidohydrolase family protein, partial [Acidobacteriota bacterium]|nr:amidohydrolase family protein [Acidobacteriota bacterium]